MATTPHPETLLNELGVTEPKEIDLEAIAAHLGVEVTYRTLDGCEARIVGRGSRGRITVDNRVAPTRQRFSIGHELGHWQYHRGAVLYCRSSDIGSEDQQAIDGERVANWYAANLLMPEYLFRPIASDIRPSWKEIRSVAAQFKVSPLAAALRMISLDTHPFWVACYDIQSRRWFRQSDSTPKAFPHQELDHRSQAMSALLSDRDLAARNVSGAVWFSGRDLAAIRFNEDCLVQEKQVFVLLQRAS